MKSYFQKFTESVKKWIGKSVDYDRAYGSQCVDFARQYCYDVGRPIGTFSGSALNGWKTGSPFKAPWTRINYAKGMVPQAGDVVFFDKSASNPYGHVAIAGNESTSTFIDIIEQNAGSGNGDGKGNNAVARRKLKYDARGACLGWFRYNA